MIGIGDYRFDDEYVHLEVSLSKWSSMSQAQRKRHLEKIDFNITRCKEI